MHFFIRKRKQTPTIIVVALIDVLIVLLIFLIVTTTFKHQPALKLTLPQSTQAQKAGASETAPLIVTIDQEGTLRLGPDSQPVTVERLREELKERAAANPELKLSIHADTKAPWGQVIEVMDAAKAAKIMMVNAGLREPAK